MVRDLSAFGSGPTGVIEAERLLARSGIVSCRRNSVDAPRALAPLRRAACSARGEQRRWLPAAKR
eukprot:4469313-Pleurochrysis_carterae.AAC.1